jgi:hypothetical protein
VAQWRENERFSIEKGRPKERTDEGEREKRQETLKEKKKKKKTHFAKQCIS